MTLIEIMVVLLVITLVVGALAVGYNRLPATALKSEAVHVASALRAAYDGATASGAYHRMVLDLDEGTYRVERCEGKLQVRRARDVNEEMDRIKDEAEKAARIAQDAENAAKNAAAGGGQATPPGYLSPDQLLLGIQATASPSIGGAGGQSGAHCEPMRGEIGKPQKLGGHPRVAFSRVWVGHLEEPVQRGQVTITFMPLGTVEKAVIELSTDPENLFSIGVHPISGRIEMMQGQMRRPEDFLNTDAMGSRI
jgi:hypothetical protein